MIHPVLAPCTPPPLFLNPCKAACLLHLLVFSSSILTVLSLLHSGLNYWKVLHSGDTRLNQPAEARTHAQPGFYITTFCFNDYNQKHLYNIFNIRKWMQIFFFFFWLTVTAMKTNRGTEEVGTAWRWSRKRAVYWRDQTAGDVSEETYVFTYPFSQRAHGGHDISLISCYLNRGALVAYMGELHNEKLRCIKPLLSPALVTAVVITE